jgi:hypothetical protein
MPIYALLKKQDAFAPEQVEALAKVFKDVLQALGLVHRTDPVTELVAKKVVELATGGISDPDRVRALTIQAFTQQQRQQQQQQLQRATAAGSATATKEADARRTRNGFVRATLTVRTRRHSPGPFRVQRCPQCLRPVPPCSGGFPLVNGNGPASFL